MLKKVFFNFGYSTSQWSGTTISEFNKEYSCNWCFKKFRESIYYRYLAVFVSQFKWN